MNMKIQKNIGLMDLLALFFIIILISKANGFRVSGSTY